MTKKYTLCASLCALLFATAFVSCNKFGGQEVPSYIHIDSITVNCDYAVYGASTSKITDAWVYVDDQIVGCFELPATFPVLERGKQKVTIFGGISVNGIGASRAPYPFYAPYTQRDVNLVEDSIVTINPVIDYYTINESFKIAWMEDFESANTLVKMPESDTGVIRVSHSEGAWTGDAAHSWYSAMINLPPDSLDFFVANSEELTFHKDLNGKECILEMDYCCSDTFLVGFVYYKNYHLYQYPMLKVLPTDKTHARPETWKKLYVPMGYRMGDTEHETADYVKVFFTSDLSGDASSQGYEYKPLNEERYYFFDNLKLLYHL